MQVCGCKFSWYLKNFLKCFTVGISWFLYLFLGKFWIYCFSYFKANNKDPSGKSNKIMSIFKLYTSIHINNFKTINRDKFIIDKIKIINNESLIVFFTGT